jgi:hypothetical protein
MNEFEVTSAIQLDRFVDGELSEPQHREMLLAIECEPDGWRRLALAFVESQTLRSELAAWTKPVGASGSGSSESRPLLIDVVPPERSPADKAKPGLAKGGIGWLRMAGLAACSLIAFGLGRWSTPANGGMARIASPAAPTPQTFKGPPSDDGQVVVADAASSPTTESQQTLRLVLDDLLGGPPQLVDVPVVSNSDIDPASLLDAPPAIPIEVQRALLRAGRIVHEERQLFEVELSDGRRGFVPVSDVMVVNAGLNVYQ